MNKLLLSISIFIMITFTAFSQIKNANEGKRFIVTFPQNENVEYTVHKSSVKLGLYISSQKDADVQITNHHNGRIINRAVRANDFIQLDNFELGFRTDLEDLTDEYISNKVIEITSDEDISVSVINSKQTTSDGYLAYPVEEWGNNYIHNSLYHARYSRDDRSSGFTIIAGEDNTNISVHLKGKNGNLGTTKSSNNTVGDSFTLSLNANQSYTVKTKSIYTNRYDLSGSLITSDKPVGVISFHERTRIPQVGTEGGMDNLLEMQQPLSNWRNKFVSVSLGRRNGDFFRALPMYDNTNLTITNFNENGQFLSQETTEINTSGGFYEYNNTDINGYNRNREEGIKGLTIWEADKPILVTQYSYSYSWDIQSIFGQSANGFDPFMLNLINDEQFTKNVNFLAPPYGDFENHRVNLVVKVDTTQDIETQLKSIVFDNQFLHQLYPELLNNRIGTTEYYWLRFNIEQGTHNLQSEVLLAAFVYGFGEADSYGMQTALGELELIDTLIVQDNSQDCDVVNVDYQLKSTFGSDDESLESFTFKIRDFKITDASNFDYNIKLNEERNSINLTGRSIDPTRPYFFSIAIESETEKMHYDTLTISNFNNIVLAEELNLNSNPGEEISIPISIDEISDTLTYLEEYKLSFNYDPNWFSISDVIVDGVSEINNTEITAYSIFSSLSLTVPVLRESITNGNEIIIIAETQLSKDTILTPNVILTSKFGDICYTGVSSLEIESQVCAHDIRQVELMSPETIEIKSNTITALENANISIYNYVGSAVINELTLDKFESIEIDNYLKKKGLYFIKENNRVNKTPIKFFYQ